MTMRRRIAVKAVLIILAAIVLLMWYIVGMPVRPASSAQLTGRYWYLRAVSPHEVVSIIPDLFEEQCRSTAGWLVRKGWSPERVDCALENPPPARG